ncbi:hypothetical protein A33Q_2540 [Indibacter alkaliphilus LW1]|uniref:Uncharacterized protein n=1 Tax=Indibacter alkaliphilus (strain CCUG 57479 / KCTC 22604 / LW1) TaxID=1189612 RepID=S2D9L5_INDAL|nr:hypothetical protein [Indibacter alkaliphilus]EOZ95947.1 hypothetical protein A33Q_2540 [Indibacter alkaliphilus LW1]
MNRKELEAFRKAYQKAAKKSIKANNGKGKPIEEQSDWVWFDRDSIQKLLDMTDPKTGGIKIYFGQYDKENVEMLPHDRKNREEYVGRVSVALVACDKTEKEYKDIYSELSSETEPESLKSDGGISPMNAGELCPPSCNP